MKVREAISRLDRLQKSGRFKLIASIAIAVLAAVAIGVIAVAATAPDAAGRVARAADQAVRTKEAIENAQAAAQGVRPDEATSAALRAAGPRANPILLGSVGVAAAAGIALIVVWLGLALTYLAIAALGFLVAGPLLWFTGTRNMGEVVLGALALAASFSAISQGIRMALARPQPVFAIARNVLAESVRMKISLIFIVLLIFFLAGLPFFLDSGQPLRYRVQLFLQYGTSGTFWVLALLTIFFAIATVAFEQRDKIIWQTMTKPVRPWQYVLGKWLGVVALNTSLLAVSATGVFLFTERLRAEPAKGEVRAYVAEEGGGRITDDRRILESQVLTARDGRGIGPPNIDMATLEQSVDEEWKGVIMLGYNKPTDVARRKIRERRLREVLLQYRSVEPGQSQGYDFLDLSGARESGRPISVRFKINSGSDNPSNLLRLTFVIAGQYAVVREAVLNTAQVFDIPDDVVPPGTPDRERAMADVRANCIDATGKMSIQVWNGDVINGLGNPRAISFPPDGLEVLYAAGTYEGNFLRVACVLWLKLAFIAAVAVACATFLAFPVACLVTMGLLFAVETAGYLGESLDYYEASTKQGVDYVMVAARAIAVPMAYCFRWYADLKPTVNLTDGRLVSWMTLAQAAGFLGVASLVSLFVGWGVFRRRELATYSGK